MRSDNTLYMSIVARQHSSPGTPVTACHKCQQRELSRNGSPTPPSGSLENHDPASSGELDHHVSATPTSKGKMPAKPAPDIVVFKRSPLEVSQNNINMRLRVTCYSSHHEGTEGFEYVKSIYSVQTRFTSLGLYNRLTFILRDSQGRIVGHGTSLPIRIIDSRSRKVQKKNDGRQNRRQGERTITGERDVSSSRRRRHDVPALDHIHSSSLPVLDPEFQIPFPMNLTNDSPPSLALAARDGPPTHSIHEDTARGAADPMPWQQTRSEVPLDPSLDELFANLFHRPAPQPQVQVVIPSSGPLDGGIEATVLGANFDHSHKCVFGDNVADTTLWNSGALTCIVPRGVRPGPVLVTIEGHPLVVGGGRGATHAPVWFHYQDSRENDMWVAAPNFFTAPPLTS